MLPVIAVDVAPADASAANVATMLEACTLGLPRGRCIGGEASLSSSSESLVAVAVVTWSADGLEVHVELGKRAEQHKGWLGQTLEFHSSDPLDERWRTTGFAIASLAGRAEVIVPTKDDDDRSVTGDTPPPRLPRDESSDQVERERRQRQKRSGEGLPNPRTWLALSVGPSMGRGLDDDSLRVGGWGKVAAWPFSLPVFVAGSLDASGAPAAPENLGVIWITPRLSLGFSFAHSATDLELRVGAGGVFEHVLLSATEAGGGTDDAARWMLGVGLDAELSWPASGDLAGLFGFRFAHFDGGTGVVVDGTAAPSVPAVTYQFTVGAQWQLKTQP